MPHSSKPASSWRSHRSSERGITSVAASWFVLILLLTLVCFVWYVDSTTRIRAANNERGRLEAMNAARRDRVEYRRTQAKALSALIGVRSAIPTLTGESDEAGLEVSRVADLKAFAEELVNFAQPMFKRGMASSTHKPDFYLKRALDEDGMVPPMLPTQGVEYDEEAYANASDPRQAGFDIMQEIRKNFVEPFGGDASDVRTDADGKAALKFRDLRAQWASLFDSTSRNYTGDTAAGEIDAISRIRSTGGGDGWAPTISLTEIVHQIALKYEALEADTDALRAAWEAKYGAAVPPGDAAWNDLRHIAYAAQTGNASSWDLDKARTDLRAALTSALGAAYGGSAGDEQTDAFLEARLAAMDAGAIVALYEANPPLFPDGDEVPAPFAPLSSDEDELLGEARAALQEAQGEIDRVEQQLGRGDDDPAIGPGLDHLVAALGSIDRYEALNEFLTAKAGDDEPYDPSTDGYRAFLSERADNLKSALSQALTGMRGEADSFDSEYATAFEARTGLGTDVYEDPNGRSTPSVGGDPEDTAEAYGLPFGENRGPKDIDSVVSTGIGDISQVLALMQAETAALDTQRDDVVIPATESAKKNVRDRGQRLGSLLVSDAIETVFPDVAKGRVLQAPAGPVPSIRISGNAGSAVAFIDLDASDNLRVGTRFFVVEPLSGGGKLVKALGTVDRIGKTGEPSRIVLRYLSGVDPLTHSVVRGDVLENSVFNGKHRRNVVIVVPENESFRLANVRAAMTPNHFYFQDGIDENADMVVLAASRRDSLAAMAAAAADEFGDGGARLWFQDNELFLEAERRGLNVFFFEDDVRPRIPGGGR